MKNKSTATAEKKLVKLVRKAKTEYKSFGFACIRPTVHLICRHSRATVGLYAGETVCFVLYLGILQFIDRIQVIQVI